MGGQGREGRRQGRRGGRRDAGCTVFVFVRLVLVLAARCSLPLAALPRSHPQAASGGEAAALAPVDGWAECADDTARKDEDGVIYWRGGGEGAVIPRGEGSSEQLWER
eukprot:scaffold136423_cov23-Tisochrysis_lutea.AAC.1